MFRKIFMILFSPHPSLFVLPHGPQTLFETEPASCNHKPASVSPRPLKTQPLKYFLEYSGVMMGLRPLLEKQPVLCPATSEVPSMALTPSVCLPGASPASKKPLSESALATQPHPAQTSSLPLPATAGAPVPARPSDHRFLHEELQLQIPKRHFHFPCAWQEPE